MSNSLKIKLNIAGKPYALNINRTKEEMYRRAEKEINKQLATFESQFKSDKEGYLAMTALQIALNNMEMANSRSLGEDLDELIELEQSIDNYLNKI